MTALGEQGEVKGSERGNNMVNGAPVMIMILAILSIGI